jgi:diguanylate cyclase (GGDEF)-like protein
MSSNKPNDPANTPRLLINNVIEFPRRCASPPPAEIRQSPASLLKLWDRAGQQEALARVPEQLLHTLQRLQAAGRAGALCVLRITDHRLFEETFGARIGKQLRGLVASRLRCGLRGSDLLEPIGDDEFVLLLDGQVNDEQLGQIAKRLLRDSTGTYTLEGLRMHVTASLGIARYPQDAGEAAQLMRFARIALHEAQPHSPTPYHFFSQQLLQQLQTRLWLAAELEEALAAGRFELHYQPLFDLQSQRILGAEALVRLRTEPGELIPPAHFIPLAEEMGLIIPLGRWVIQEACQQLKRWHEQGHGQLRMAVNVSATQLADAQFVADVSAAVEEAGITHAALELEITESQVVAYLPLIEQAFRELDAKGVHIAIDDFGTGYSALAYLTRLHWSTVKIDRTFLREIPHERKAGRVISAIIAMAGELGMQVTAEGVETEAQYRFLRQTGCHQGQGYGYARPQPAEDFSRLLLSPDVTGWAVPPEMNN